MLGFNAIVADSDEQSELLASSQQQAFVSLRTGHPIRLPPPTPNFADELPLEGRAMLRQVLAASGVGSPATVGAKVRDFVERTRADELIVTAQVYDHQARLKSYELLMESVRQPSNAAAK
jgi:alkanesulfonate monooxygenase SsuD/methylene tetrahydromethanopterin reductase-like flavin-dependent oxidoreductase (luciferase family)